MHRIRYDRRQPEPLTQRRLEEPLCLDQVARLPRARSRGSTPAGRRSARPARADRHPAAADIASIVAASVNRQRPLDATLARIAERIERRAAYAPRRGEHAQHREDPAAEAHLARQAVGPASRQQRPGEQHAHGVVSLELRFEFAPESRRRNQRATSYSSLNISSFA